MKEIGNVLSLFDGMSCLQIALIKQGIKFNTYYSSEIDKHAIAQTQLNFSDTIQLGDVTKWREWDIEWSKIDLIGAGSPCQGFSFAGKQLAFDDPRSKLFFVFVEILNHCKQFNPNVKFLLENVDMKKEHLRVISEYCGIFPVNINSNLVSAQNRNRWYWSNIRVKKVGLFDELYTDIPQPKDEGILLRDILDKKVDEKYYISNKMFNRISKTNNGEKCFTTNNKSMCLAAGYHKSGRDNQYVKEACIKFGRTDEAKGIRKQSMKNGKDYTPFQAKEIVDLDFEKMNTLTTATTKDNLIMQINPSLESGGKQPYQQNRIYDENGITPALCANKSDLLVRQQNNLKEIDEKANAFLSTSWKGSQANGMTLIEQKYRIRRLTPNECAKLQTIPSWYKWKCSDTQQYKMLGNGWTIDVISHILSFI